MSEQQRSILATIQAIHRDTYAPARTIAIAGHVYMSDRNVRRYLRKLEQVGAVRRVGCHGGWLPAIAA